MTVLETDLSYSQYTGTGARTFFEYDFDWDGEPVLVLVDNVPVEFEQQTTGVMLAEAPILDAEVLIYRVTDITQLRDFQAFEAFKGEKTEAACDKLIRLKREAALWRARMNLAADQQLTQSDITNDKGSDADVLLWNEKMSGVFAGEVSNEIPDVGTFVAKPEDFAYFQHGNDGSGALNFDNFVFLSDNGEQCRIFDYNFDTDEYRLIGAMLANDFFVLGDGTNTFFYRLVDVNQWAISEYVWRGHAYTLLGDIDVPSGVVNSGRDCILNPELNRFLIVGAAAFENGVSTFKYDPDSLQQPYTDLQIFNSSNNYIRVYDVQQGDEIGLYQYGTGFLATPNGSQPWTTARWDSDTENYVEVDQLVKEDMNNPQFNRFSRYASGNDGSDVLLVKVDEDLNLTDEGSVTVGSEPYVTLVDHGHIVTVEGSPASNQFLKTYNMAGVEQDSFELNGSYVNDRVVFQVSPHTGRLWLFGASSGVGLNAFRISDTGQITRDGYVPNEAAFNEGGLTKQRMVFFRNGMTITPNGFTGIKEKLFECWEFEDDLTGAMGNMDLVDAEGTTASPTYLTGGVGKRAYLNGNAALGSNGETPSELQAISNYSLCFDVVPDAIPGPSGEQHIFKRGKLDSIEFGGNLQWDCGAYINAAGNFIFWVNTAKAETSFTPYEVQAGSLVAVGGTKYHVYVEFDRILNRIGIRVNGGALHTLSIPALESHVVWAQTDRRFFIGQRSTNGGDFRRFKGSVDQFFWFYDVLTSTQQDWMYNSGNSRAFSEL